MYTKEEKPHARTTFHKLEQVPMATDSFLQDCSIHILPMYYILSTYSSFIFFVILSSKSHFIYYILIYYSNRANEISYFLKRCQLYF
jgi:hypothetical protein